MNYIKEALKTITYNCIEKCSIRQATGHHFISNVLSSNSVVLDFGANTGEFTDFVSNNYNVAVYAFEANGELIKSRTNNPKVKFFNFAIVDKDGPCKFFLSDSSKAHSIYKDIAGKDTCIEVEGMTINSILKFLKLEQVDLLKVDIEGAEINVLNSISPKDLLVFDQITIEFHDFVNPKLRKDVDNLKRKIVATGFIEINILNSNIDILFLNKRLLKKFGKKQLIYLYALKYFFLRLRKFWLTKKRRISEKYAS